jgi:hypothetical protein
LAAQIVYFSFSTVSMATIVWQGYPNRKHGLQKSAIGWIDHK